MAITILSQPLEVAFSRNPLVYEFQTDARVAVAGKPFIAKLSFPDYTAPLFSFELTWAGRAPKKFDVGPDVYDDGSGIHNGAGKTPQEFYEQAAADFLSNNYIRKDFKVEAAHDGISWYLLFTSIKNEAVYNLSVNQTNYVSLQILQTAADEILNKNLKLYMELYFERGDRSGFNKLFESYLDVDEKTGKSAYDASFAITAELFAEKDRPRLDLPVARKDVNSVGRYYLVIAEVYGEPQKVRKMITLDTRTAFYGGISKEKLSEFRFLDHFVRGNLVHFMKQDPDEKKLTPDTPEYLTWAALRQDESAVTLKTTIYFADGSTLALPGSTFNGVKKNDKFTWPVGITQNSWHLLPGEKAILKYECVVVNLLQSAISPVKTYHVDYAYNKYTRFFNYLGSWGSYDTLVTTGKGAFEYDLTMSAAEITQVGGYKLVDGDAIDFESALSQTESVTSGFRENKREVRQFRDLFLSTDRFLLRKGRAYPITINSKSIKEFQDGNNLLAIAFEIGNRYKEKLWTFDDKDDIPSFPLFPIIVGGGGGAGGTNLPENYFDYRYYLKSQTYNRTEIDTFLNQLTQDFIALRTQYLAAIANLTQQLVNKSDINHDHDLRYALKADFDQYGIFPMTITNDLPEYSEANGNVIITIPELKGMSGYPVRNTATNLLFQPDLLDYNEEDGVLTIYAFSLPAGQTITIG